MDQKPIQQPKPDRKKLEEEKRDLEEQLKAHQGHQSFGTDVDHFEEEADEAEEFSANLGIQRGLKQRIEEIDGQLRKMDEEKK